MGFWAKLRGFFQIIKIMGFSQIPMNLIMMGAPAAAGFLFDSFRSYTVPFVGLAVLINILF